MLYNSVKCRQSFVIYGTLNTMLHTLVSKSNHTFKGTIKAVSAYLHFIALYGNQPTGATDNGRPWLRSIESTNQKANLPAPGKGNRAMILWKQDEDWRSNGWETSCPKTGLHKRWQFKYYSYDYNVWYQQWMVLSLAKRHNHFTPMGRFLVSWRAQMWYRN